MYKFLIPFFVILTFSSVAQINDVLSYEQAVALTLQNNFDIKIAENNASIFAIENNLGNAGFLPTLDINANGTYANNATRQEFSNGQSVNQQGVVSKNINTGAYISYTLFDGFKMFATKERLSLLAEQGEINFKMQIENSIEQLTYVYYQIVKQVQLIKGIQAALDVSEERIKLALKKLDIGSGSNVELLQARLDANAQKSNLITQNNMLQGYKKNLLLLMQIEQAGTFTVDSNFTFASMQSMDPIREQIEQKNTSILFAQKNLLVTKQIQREIRSQSLPKLSINNSYAFGRNQNAAGFSLFNQNVGYNFGFGVSWNVFNGWVTKRQLQVNDLQYKNNIMQLDKIRSSLISESATAYIRWLGDQEILQLEEENIKMAEQSLYITMERMKMGLGNYLEVKESQSSYEQAITRLVNARYNVKESETKLKRISGDLVK